MRPSIKMCQRSRKYMHRLGIRAHFSRFVGSSLDFSLPFRSICLGRKVGGSALWNESWCIVVFGRGGRGVGVDGREGGHCRKRLLRPGALSVFMGHFVNKSPAAKRWEVYRWASTQTFYRRLSYTERSRGADMEILFTAVVVGSTAEIAWVTISTDGTEYCGSTVHITWVRIRTNGNKIAGSTVHITSVTISTDGTEYCWQYSSYNVGHN